MVLLKLTRREIRTLELAFEQANEPPYSDLEDAEHIDTIKSKLRAAAARSSESD